MLAIRSVEPPVTPEAEKIMLEQLNSFCRLLSQFTGGAYTWKTLCCIEPEYQSKFYNLAVQHLIPVPLEKSGGAERYILDCDILPDLYEIVREGCLWREMERAARFLKVPAEQLKELPVKKQEQLLGIFAFEYDAEATASSKQILADKMKICAGIHE